MHGRRWGSCEMHGRVQHQMQYDAMPEAVLQAKLIEPYSMSL